MKKLALFLTVVLCMGLISAMPASAALSANPVSFAEGEETLFLNVNGYDIVPNGSMEFSNEGTFSSWGVTCNQSIGGVSQNFVGSDIIFQNGQDAHGGTYSLQITNPSATNASGADASTCIRMGVDVIAGVTYEMSVFVKSLDVTSGYAYFHGMFTDASGSNAPFSRMNRTYQNPTASSPIVLPENTWVKKGLRFTAPEGATRLTIYYYLVGKGSVLYDDIMILAPKESMSGTVGDAKKQPCLTENSSDFGNIYAQELSLGTFESYSDGYFLNKSERTGPSAHNAQVTSAYNHTEGGSKSLHLKNKINAAHGDFQPNLYYKPIYLVPGATYQISTWILAPEPGTSADFSYWINFEKSDGATDQKKQHFGVKTYGWWREFIFEFTVPADSGNVKTNIELRLMHDIMEYYIDDVTIYMVEKPPHADVRTDEMFYYTDFLTGTCSADAFSSYKEELVGGRVDYALLDTDGTTVLDSESVKYVNDEANYEFSLALLEEKGEKYFVSAKIYNEAGELLQEEVESIYRYDRPTYLGADGIFRKNGKEYNLIFGSGVTTALLEADPRRGGVTVVRLVADGTTLESRMDKAHEMGLLCMVGLYGNGKINSTESIINTVNGVKNHPALFGYQVQDEPYQKGDSEEDLARAYKAIRDNDPHHAAYLVDSVEGGFDYLFRYADFVEIDYYGGAGPDSGRIIGQKMDAARVSSKGRKPFGLTQQVFQYEGYRPTVDELRNFAYQNFFSGANAIGYHSLGVDGSDGITTPFMYMEDWTELCERWATWEQGFLLDCFVNGKHTLLNSYSDENVKWRTYLADGELYAIVYNRQKNANSEAIIPLTDSEGNSLMSNFSAVRVAGTKGEEGTVVRGLNSLKLSLGGIVGRQGGMTLQNLDGLAAEIWKISPLSNVIPNGDFEISFNGAPSSEWSVTLHTTAAGIGTLGSASSVSSATVGETQIAPAVTESSRFLKLERHNGQGGDVSKLNDRPTFIYTKIDSSVLTEGKSYRFEYYVNIPSGALGEGVKGRVNFQNGASSHFGNFRDHNWFAPDSESMYMTGTNGWEKRIVDFVYDGSEIQLNIGLFGAGAAGTMFIDEMKLYEHTPDRWILQKQTFTHMTTETANTYTNGGYVTRTSRGSVSIEADPVNASNKVMKVHPTNLDNPVASVLKMKAEDAVQDMSTFTPFDTVKVSFRLYVPTANYTSGDIVKATNVDGFNFGVLYYDDKAGSTSSTSSKTQPILAFSGTDANKWLNIELYLKAFCIKNPILSFMPRQFFDFYVDDIVVEKINTAAYISNMQVTHYSANTRLTDLNNDQNWAYMVAGNYGSTYKTTDVIQPVIAFTSQNATANAIAIAKVYKVEDGAETLVDLKVQNVGRCAIADLSGAKASETGVASDELKINLGEKELAPGTYRAEWCIWSPEGLSPLAEMVSFTITE